MFFFLLTHFSLRNVISYYIRSILSKNRGDFVTQTSTVGLKILIENSTLELESSQGYPERMPVLVGYY